MFFDRSEALSKEGAVAHAGSLHSAQPLAQRERCLVEAWCLREVREERKSSDEQRFLLRGQFRPVDEEIGGITLGEPECGLGEEPEAGLRAGYATVRERACEAPKIGAAVESREDPFDLRENHRVVRIGAQECECLVQLEHRARARELRSLQLAEEVELPATDAFPITGADCVEGRQLQS